MKTIDSTAKRGFTRRSFIKGAATLTAAGLLTGCSANTEDLVEDSGSTVEAGKEEIFAGACSGNCFGGCFLNVHVRDGQVVRFTARDMLDKRYNRICTKGLSHMGRIYSANRLQYPMRRVGERGAGEFERISWDEAIDEIATKWQGYRDEFGLESIAVMSQSGNLRLGGGINGIGSFLTRFVNIMGMSKVNSNLDWAVAMSGIISFGGNDLCTNNEPTDYENASTIVIWGANPAVSQLHNMHFIMEAKEKGTRIIDIDPVYNMTVAKADEFVPINATTDGALALGIINEVVKNGWQDVEFLRAHSEAAFLVKPDGDLMKMSDLGVAPTEGPVNQQTGKPTVIDPYVVWDESTNSLVEADSAQQPAITGVVEANGMEVQTTFDYLVKIASEYTPEKVEEITGVPASKVRELAEVYTQNGPVLTYMQHGADHYINGHWSCWSIYALSMICGQIGKPGASCGPTGVNAGSLLNKAVNTAPDSNGNACPPAGRGLNVNMLDSVLDTGQYNGKPISLKSVYIMGNNPVSICAEQGYTERWLSKIDFVVVADENMNDTAKWADILLPVADWYEQTDVYGCCGTHPYFIWNEKAVEPLCESRSDFDIYKAILEKMGLSDYWQWETPEDAIKEILDSEKCHSLNIEFEKLKSEKIVRCLPGEVFYKHEGGVFLTPTKRCRFYQETPYIDTVGEEIDISKERAPHWEPTLEADKNSEARKKHPFHLLSDHMRTRTHTQWWDVECLKEVETDPVVKINPADAADLGIAEGDEVRVYNDRGSVTLRAVINAGLPRGMMSAPRGFQRSEFIDGHFQGLSIMKFNQACANQPFNDVAVSIEKI